MLDLVLAASAKTPEWFICLGHWLLFAFIFLCLPGPELVALVVYSVWMLIVLLAKGVTGLVQLARRK